ncbi:MAG: NADH-quinone oxidoreductase subunit C [Woeseiaceae bacterium]|nr:NADH-quinone oxidoreductase subunit C [Woeseiaceae bacterium]
MSESRESMAARIDARFGDRLKAIDTSRDLLSYEVAPDALIDACRTLRDDEDFRFEQLTDICGVDFLTYGQGEWTTYEATESGFSRGVQREPVILDESDTFDPRRFAAVYHLLSIENNIRLRLRVYTGENNPPVLPSVVDIWSGANWFEREAFDLFGILFDGHPDLRRILTDYGFIGHPFRKDFPLIGNVEVTYDAEQGRVAYQPVSIEPRTLVPRVLRNDNRYTVEKEAATTDG